MSADVPPQPTVAPDGSDAHQTEVTPIQLSADGLMAAHNGVRHPTPDSQALVADRYRLEALLGRGGMGSVYRALDTALDEVVALKFLSPDLTADPALRERFRREVVLTRRVTHTNVARMYDIGEHEGALFLTMELIAGESLGALLARESRLPVPDMIRLAQAICDGLAAAHAVGVVHRDLKPDNVLIEHGGRVVVTDFGVARAISSQQTAQLTAGQMVGTPAYMAPEQLEGQPEIDQRADIYALGVMMIQMLSGELPWKGESTFALIRARIQQPVPDFSGLAPDCPLISQLLAGCLAESPADRYADTHALQAAIVEACAAHNKDVTTGHRGRAPTRLISGRLRAAGASKTIAVLPFNAIGADDGSDIQYLGEGLAEELADVLSMQPGLRVRPAGSRQPGADPLRVGRELDVQVVVSGRLRRAGNALTLSARLNSVSDGFSLWAKRFTAEDGDPFALIDELAGQIGLALGGAGSEPEPAESAEPAEQRMPAEAADLFLRGRHAMHQGWFHDVSEAVEIFEQALELAPNDPRILSVAASANARQLFFSIDGGVGVAERANQLAQRAIVAAPERGEPHQAMAMLRLYQVDPVGAVLSLRRALRLAPRLAEAHELLGRLLLEVGPLEEAVGHLEQALRLDPSLPNPRVDLVKPLAYAGDWARVSAALELLTRNDAERQLSELLMARYAFWCRLPGDVQLPGQKHDHERAPEGPARFAQLMRQVRSEGRLCDEVHAEIQLRIDKAPPRSRIVPLVHQQFCEMHAYLGDTERALDAMSRAVETGLFDLVWCDRCPVLGALRVHPRWSALRAPVAARVEAALNTQA